MEAPQSDRPYPCLDAACLGDRTPPVALLAEVSQPALVLTGGSVPPFEAAADAVAAALPPGERRVLEGMGHVPNPAQLAGVLAGFFGNPGQPTPPAL